MKSKRLIIGNWKMYPVSVKDSKTKFVDIKKVASALRNVQTVICPPFVYVSDLQKLATGHRCTIGAQNAWIENEGAYTGEVSPLMLSSLKLTHVIVGHSERRAIGESDELVNKKVLAGIKADALEVSILIKKTLSDLYGKEGMVVPILYGGSVDAKNAWEFLTKSQVDGLLVGRASLDPKTFGEILMSAEKIK